MGGPVITTIRPGVEFVPEAAAAFRRAEAQVRAEFGRGIDVNSTYRDWDTQLRMYNAWQAYISGRGPYPGHSKALHPADPLAFHTKGLALDSDDWRNERIVQILAEHGFIRNRLYVPNEQHHFEYLRDYDKHINDAAPAGLAQEDDMFEDRDRALLEQIRGELRELLPGKAGVRYQGETNKVLTETLQNTRKLSSQVEEMWQRWLPGKKGVKTQGDLNKLFVEVLTNTRANAAALKVLAEAQGVDPDVIQRTVDQAVRDALSDVEITLKAGGAEA